MGAMCPVCQTFQPIKAVHTVSGAPPKKSDDVISVTLGCDHGYGSEEFNTYQKLANKISMDVANAIRELQKKATAEIGLRYQEMISKKTVGKA